MSVILAAFCAAWAVQQYRVASQMVYAVAAVVSVASAAVLAVYGAAFRRKTRNL